MGHAGHDVIDAVKIRAVDVHEPRFINVKVRMVLPRRLARIFGSL